MASKVLLLNIFCTSISIGMVHLIWGRSFNRASKLSSSQRKDKPSQKYKKESSYDLFSAAASGKTMEISWEA
jgi:hypothetical protein